MHESCKNHMQSAWHKSATMAAKSFLDSAPVDVQLISAHEKMVEENKKIVKSIISTVMFCGTHDLPFRGKEIHTGVFEDLIRFKAESGDQELDSYISRGKKNLTYLSPHIQNELIAICGEVVCEEIVKDVKLAEA